MSSVGHSSNFLQTFHFSVLLGSLRLISLIASGTFQQGDPTSHIIRKKELDSNMFLHHYFKDLPVTLICKIKVELERLNMG